MIGKHGAMVAAIVLIAGVAFWLNRPVYGQISPHGYELATALYSACNQEDPERLSAVAELTDQSVQADELSAAETQWLGEIIEQARAGRWKLATTQTRQLMEAQVEGK